MRRKLRSLGYPGVALASGPVWYLAFAWWPATREAFAAPGLVSRIDSPVWPALCFSLVSVVIALSIRAVLRNGERSSIHLRAASSVWIGSALVMPAVLMIDWLRGETRLAADESLLTGLMSAAALGASVGFIKSLPISLILAELEITALFWTIPATNRKCKSLWTRAARSEDPRPRS